MLHRRDIRAHKHSAEGDLRMASANRRGSGIKSCQLGGKSGRERERERDGSQSSKAKLRAQMRLTLASERARERENGKLD